ncbi:unnamed protein product, partial [Meganyctiphanes norvegica]
YSYFIGLGLPYDYLSLMHYRANSFSEDGRPTITVLEEGVTIGQRVGFSEICPHSPHISQCRKLEGDSAMTSTSTLQENLQRNLLHRQDRALAESLEAFGLLGPNGSDKLRQRKFEGDLATKPTSTPQRNLQHSCQSLQHCYNMM